MKMKTKCTGWTQKKESLTVRAEHFQVNVFKKNFTRSIVLQNETIPNILLIKSLIDVRVLHT